MHEEPTIPRQHNFVTAVPTPINSKTVALSPAEVHELARHAIVLDVRAADAFAGGHVPGAVCISLNHEFMHWARQTLGKRQVILVAENDGQIREACKRLVGTCDVIGWLSGGLGAWEAAGLRARKLPQISVFDLHNYVENGWAQVLDVRPECDWLAGHIEGARWHALESFLSDLPCLGEAGETCAVHCDGGSRSLIAVSLLLRAGLRNVAHVIGGLDAWVAAGFPITQDFAAD